MKQRESSGVGKLFAKLESAEEKGHCYITKDEAWFLRMAILRFLPKAESVNPKSRRVDSKA